MPRSPRLFLVLSLLISLSAQAGRRRVPDLVEDALAFATTDRNKAVALLENALAEGASADDAPIFHLFAGEQQRLAGQNDAAHKHFAKVLELTTSSSEVDAARLGLALLDTSRDSNNLSVLRSVSTKYGLQTQNADRFLVLATQAAHEDNAKAASSNARKALQYAKEDPQVLARVDAALQALLAPADDPADTPQPSHSDNSGSIIEQAEAALDAGNTDKARKLANQAQAAAPPDSHEALTASYLLRRIDANRPVDPNKIAVLIPQSGKYEAVGRKIRDALALGYTDAAARRTLVYYDTKGDPDTAVAMLERAVLEDGVIAVIGPVLTSESGPVSKAADALRVPLFSLSQSLDDISALPWVFQPMLSEHEQINALLDHVMSPPLSMKAFAIFAPTTDYGTRATHIFKQEVSQRGGTVTVVATYDTKATDFIQFAKVLGRKDYEARKSEFYRIKREVKEAGGDPSRAVLPPVLDFDALFMPDNATRIPLAAAGLAYEEFPMGDFQTSRKGATFPLLGLSAWNHHSLVQRGGPYVRGAFFVDGYLSPPPAANRKSWQPDAGTTAFTLRYREATGHTPTSLEAATFDVGAWLANIAQATANTRDALREAALEAHSDGASTGLRAIDPQTRTAQRKLRVLTITREGIFPVEPSTPEAPAP